MESCIILMRAYQVIVTMGMRSLLSIPVMWFRHMRPGLHHWGSRRLVFGIYLFAPPKCDVSIDGEVEMPRSKGQATPVDLYLP